ncbi:MAG: hypothetical protein QCH99_03795 [Candidatus Bathyarchaeota archaeon]|nr:hypothetical protein [Candidatus Bathyarchaeum tardum]
MATKETIITASMLILITYTLSLSLVSQAYPAEQATAKFSNSGAIQIQTTTGIGVYSNQQCTTALTSLPWGTLTPGGSSSITFYVKNEGNTQTTLSLVVDNWEPTAAGTYLGVNWDYNNAAISPDQAVAITLTLSVASNIQNVETFSFDITIIGS